jgi:hypothetical protein
LQQRDDALHRLLDVWASGEAAASLGFAAARMFDELDPLEHEKEAIMAERGTLGGTSEFKALRRLQGDVLEWIDLAGRAEGLRDDDRYEALSADPLVRFMYLDALANVFCPAAKLWNTGHGATMMREAVSLMGGYGITEDCPGFLPQKWMDAQLEATYEGPEAVQRRQLTVTMTNEVFLAAFRTWIAEMRHIADRRPGTGACTLASAMEVWLWTLDFMRNATDPEGGQLYHGARQGVTFPLADALCWLLASRCLVLDILEVESRGPENPVVAEGLLDPWGSCRTLRTFRPLVRPARSGASRQNWCSGTSVIHPGTMRASGRATRRAISRRSNRSSRACRARRARTQM